MAQQFIEPVLHWEVPLSVRASSSLGAAAATATRAATGRRVEKRMNIFSVLRVGGLDYLRGDGMLFADGELFAICFFIRRGGPLPPPSAPLRTPLRCQSVRPARMSVGGVGAYLPAIPPQQGNSEKKNQVCRKTYLQTVVAG